MTTVLEPGTDPQTDIPVRDHIPPGTFNATKEETFEEFIENLEGHTLRYVNEVCRNIMLAPDEMQGVQQSRLRKFVRTSNTEMVHPERTFCVQSVMQRKAKLGWDIKRMRHYMQLAALMGMVPTDTDNTYVSGYEDALGGFLVKEQFYEKGQDVESFNGIGNKGGYFFEHLALQIPCLEDNILPAGYILEDASPEDDRHHKVDFYLTNLSTGEKTGIQFTINRVLENVDKKEREIIVRRKKDFNGPLAVLAITPGGVHQEGYSNLLTEYRDMQDVLLAERMKKVYRPNYDMFCGQLREGLMSIIAQTEANNPQTGVIVRCIQAKTPTTKVPTLPLIESGNKETAPSMQTPGEVEETTALLTLPADLRTLESFTIKWREFMENFGNSFGNFLENMPGRDLRIRELLDSSWKSMRYAYMSHESFEICVRNLETVLNNFIVEGESGEHKDQRRNHVRAIMKVVFECEAKVFTESHGHGLSFDKTLTIWNALKDAVPVVKLTTLSDTLAPSVAAWNDARHGTLETLQAIAKTLCKTLQDTFANILDPHYYVVQQFLEKNGTKNELEAYFSHAALTNDFVQECNDLLVSICNNQQISLQTIPVPAEIIAQVVAQAPVPTVQVPGAQAPKIEKAPVPAPAPIPVAPPVPVPVVPVIPEPSAENPLDKLRQKITHVTGLIQDVRGKMDALVQAEQHSQSIITLTQRQRQQFEKSHNDLTETRLRRRAEFLEVNLTSHVSQVGANDFHSVLIDAIKTHRNSEVNLNKQITDVSSKITECDQILRMETDKLKQAQTESSTQRTNYEKNLEELEMEHEKYKTALEVIQSL